MPAGCLTAPISIDLSMVGSPAALAAEVHLARRAGNLAEVVTSGAADDLGLMVKDQAGAAQNGLGAYGFADFRVQPQTPLALGVAVELRTGSAGRAATFLVSEVASAGHGEGGVVPLRAATATPSTIGLVSIAAPDASLPRIDTIFLTALWSGLSPGGFAVPTVFVAKGTATAGATLDNRLGAPNDAYDGSVASSLVPIADVLVNAGTNFIDGTMIRDRRPWAVAGATPGYAGGDQSLLRFQGCEEANVVVQSAHGTWQSAALVHNPRAITARSLRLRYQQGATPLTSQYVVGLYGADRRRKLSAVGTFHGAAGQPIMDSLTVSYGRLYPGLYYLLFGLATFVPGGGTVIVRGAQPAVDWSTGRFGPTAFGTSYVVAAGGTTAPQTIAGFTDMATVSAPTGGPPVPAITISED